jgi:hypothetical protein
MLKPGQAASDAVRELEVEFDRHARLSDPAPYTPALPTG